MTDMSKKNRRSVNKLDYVRFGNNYTGYITSQDLLLLSDLGLKLTKNHDKRILVAEYEKKLGVCTSRWEDFLQPKQDVCKLIESVIGPKF